MRRLILLRHAKASLGNLHQPDSERPLNEQGRRQAQGLATIFQTLALMPDRILCSTAIRTRQTWEGLAAGLDHPLPVPHYCQPLYLATPERLLTVLREEGGLSQTLLVLGHNDGLQECALKLADKVSPSALCNRMSKKFPTAAMAIFACDIESWDRLSWHRNRLLHLYYPGDEEKRS